MKASFGAPSRQIVAQTTQRSGPTSASTRATSARNAATAVGGSFVPRLTTTWDESFGRPASSSAIPSGVDRADAVVRDDLPARQRRREVALDADVQRVADQRDGPARRGGGGLVGATDEDERPEGDGDEEHGEEGGGAHREGRSGQGANPAGWTLNPAIDRFLAGPGLAESTRRAYASDLADFAGWLARSGRSLDDVDVQALAEYTAELGRGRRGLAPSTIARRLAAVRSFIRFTLGAARVPEIALPPRRRRRLPDAPKLADVEDLLAAVAGRRARSRSGTRRSSS